MSDWVVIGVPTSAGAHHAGQERAPAALRYAGLVKALEAAGESVADIGDLPGSVFAVDRRAAADDGPAGHTSATGGPPGSGPARGFPARNLKAVTRVAGEVADAVAAQLETGRLPLVIGGDCTITLGVIAGFRRVHPDVGLVYVDGDADLGGALGSDGSGILDSTGVAHLLGHGTPELAGLAGPAAPGPLLEPGRLALVGGDPRETDDSGRRFLAEAGVSFQEAPALIADPAGTAARALAAVAPAAGPLVVHFDVDTVDSGDLPLANFPHYGSGVRLSQAAACLRVLRAAPTFAGLVLTEVNPTHDPEGAQLARYVDAIVSAIAVSAIAA
jgi:arginase